MEKLDTLQLEGSYEEGLSLMVQHLGDRFFFEYWVAAHGEMPEKLERIVITYREARALISFINSHMSVTA